MEKLKDDQIIPLCLKHNFWTWSSQAQVDPIPVNRAEGVYFWDLSGKRYLDFNSMTMCCNIGHGNRYVIKAIQKQVEELVYAGPHMATKPRAILGKMLAQICPRGLTKCLYTMGGAEANENAVKLARSFTSKHKIITNYRSYHGATHGAIALTGDPRRVAWEPLVMGGVVHMLNAFKYRSAFHRYRKDISEIEFTQDYLNYLEDLIAFEGAHTIAAILIEPVVGTNGIILPPQGYLQGVSEICKRNQILFIADEVMTGFGRTGAWFAVNHWDVVPDMITMAKGLTSGYAPLGAVAMREEIAEYFNERIYQGGLTYNGHPLSLAAAIANIEVIKGEHIVERTRDMDPVFSEMLFELKTAHPSVGEVRSIGLFGGIELVRSQKTHEPLTPFNSQNKEMNQIKQFTRSHGLYHYTHDNVILVIPPLIITTDQLAEGFAILSDALEISDAVVKE